jgi:hypothetical protein
MKVLLCGWLFDGLYLKLGSMFNVQMKFTTRNARQFKSIFVSIKQATNINILLLFFSSRNAHFNM